MEKEINKDTARERENTLNAEIQLLKSHMLIERKKNADIEETLKKSVDEVRQLQEVNSELRTDRIGDPIR